MNAITHFQIWLSRQPDERLNALQTLVVEGPNIVARTIFTLELRSLVEQEIFYRHAEKLAKSA